MEIVLVKITGDDLCVKAYDMFTATGNPLKPMVLAREWPENQPTWTNRQMRNYLSIM